MATNAHRKRRGQLVIDALGVAMVTLGMSAVLLGILGAVAGLVPFVWLILLGAALWIGGELLPGGGWRA
jgi:flagellar biosynthesis component FlhA